MIRPQRFENIEPPGELLRRAVGIAQALPTIQGDRDPIFLAQVRQLPCLRCGLEPCGEVSHIRSQSGTFNKRSGMGRKPPDRFVTPLCGDCHREERAALHRVGERIFWMLIGINPLLVAAKLYAAKGDIVRMRAIVLTAIAERGA